MDTAEKRVDVQAVEFQEVVKSVLDLMVPEVKRAAALLEAAGDRVLKHRHNPTTSR